MSERDEAGSGGAPRVLRSSGGGQTTELPVLIAGSKEQPERLMLIGLPRGGTVNVREWSGDAWGQEPAERSVDARSLFNEIEQAIRTGRRVNQEPFAIRRWLGISA